MDAEDSSVEGNEIASNHGTEPRVDGVILVEDLLRRCNALLGELEAFRTFVAEIKREALNSEHAVDIRQFHAPIAAEFKSLQRLAGADPSAEKTIHALHSSNLPYYTAVWEAAKASKGIMTFHKRYYWDIRPARVSKQLAEKSCALVDIVAHDGEEWIKVSTIAEHRLLFDIAKARWEEADSSSEGEEIIFDGTVGDREPSKEQIAGHSTTNGIINDGHRPAKEDEFDRLELVQTAKDLLRASHSHQIHYQRPRIRMVLPKVSPTLPPDIELVIDRIRSIGIIVDLGPQQPAPLPLESQVFPRLLPWPHPPLTDTLNIDCTILLALVSDLSHAANHPIQPNYNGAIKKQIQMESKKHLLPWSLWPAMANKKLVCTEEAAKRMREIANTIGMPNERARTELLMSTSGQTSEEIRAAFAEYTEYSVPSSLQFPIHTLPSEVSDPEIKSAIEAGRLPPVALPVAEQLTDINRSVFLFGWIHNYTTVSSNRTVARVIENLVWKEGKGERGPEIWLREPARSLLGKEKVRRK